MSEESISLRDLVISFQSESSVHLSRNGITKRFSESCVSFLKEVLKFLSTHDATSTPFKFMELPDIEKMIVVDSTEIKLLDKMAHAFAGIRNTKSIMKVQTIMDCLQGTLQSIELTPGNCPDQGYKAHLDYIKPKTLLITDLGYFSCAALAQVSQQNGYFLTRYHGRAYLYDSKGNKLCISDILYQSELPSVELNVFLGKEQRVSCRLVAIRLSDSAYSQRTMNMKHQKRRDNRMVEKGASETDRWSIMLTNLSHEQLHTEKVWQAYACRWQIELLFKLLKSELHLKNFTHQNNFRTQAEVYLKYIFLWIMMKIIFFISDEEISLMKATSVLRKFTVHLLSKSYKKIHKALSDIRIHLTKHAIKEKRPKRQSSRQVLPIF